MALTRSQYKEYILPELAGDILYKSTITGNNKPFLSLYSALGSSAPEWLTSTIAGYLDDQMETSFYERRLSPLISKASGLSVSNDALVVSATTPYVNVMRHIYAIVSESCDRLYDALIESEYDPIENYDRYESLARILKDSGQDTNFGVLTKAGKETNKKTGTETKTNSYGEVDTEDYIYGFDSSSASNQSKTVVTRPAGSSGQDVETHSLGDDGMIEELSFGTGDNARTDSDSHTTTYGKQTNDTATNHIHGNIGVTTAQQMLTEELTLRSKYNFIEIVVSLFAKELFLKIY